MASCIRCFLKQCQRAYICLVKHLLSGHFIYDVQTAYCVHITCRSERARKASTPGAERARAFKYFNNLMREMRTVSTTFRFIKKKEEKEKKNELNLKSGLSLAAQKHWPQGRSTFRCPTYIHNNDNIWKCRWRCREWRFTVDSSSDNVLLSENDHLPLTAW